jgi:hypothetical protein
MDGGKAGSRRADQGGRGSRKWRDESGRALWRNSDIGDGHPGNGRRGPAEKLREVGDRERNKRRSAEEGAEGRAARIVRSSSQMCQKNIGALVSKQEPELIVIARGPFGGRLSGDKVGDETSMGTARDGETRHWDASTSTVAASNNRTQTLFCWRFRGWASIVIETVEPRKFVEVAQMIQMFITQKSDPRPRETQTPLSSEPAAFNSVSCAFRR